MGENFAEDIKEFFKCKTDEIIEFKKIYGFTFVFITKITMIRDRLSSAETKPVGIIYDENDQYYFTPLNGNVKNIEEIVEKYVKEEEYFHSQQ